MTADHDAQSPKIPTTLPNSDLPANQHPLNAPASNEDTLHEAPSTQAQQVNATLSMENVHEVSLGDGRQLWVVGTAHVSEQSAQEVSDAIHKLQPKAVCLELDLNRSRTLQGQTEWKETTLWQAIKQGKAAFLLANLVLSSVQRRIGKALGVKPGADMLAGIEAGQACGAELHWCDRDIGITLKRAWHVLNWREKWHLLMEVMAGAFSKETITAEGVEDIKKGDLLQEAMEQFTAKYPRLKTTLIDERDAYMAESIMRTSANPIVAVVGAGHLQGMLARLKGTHPAPEVDFEALSKVPPPARWKKWISWIIPMVVMALIGYGFWARNPETSIGMLSAWVYINGGLAALGALLAWGHPLTILAAAVASPFTSLNPLLAAGWVAGAVELFVRKPKVADFESLTEDIQSLKGFWRNGISRVLLVVVLVNLGSSLGALIGIPLITSWL